MALVGRSYIEMDVSLTSALAKITQLERRANEAKQALAAPVSIGAGGADTAILSFKEMEAELAKVDAGLTAATAKTNEQAVAEARLAASLGDHTRAIELLEAQITKENAETVEGIRLATQITQLENQQTAAAERDAAAIQRQADATIRLAQSRAQVAAQRGDISGARTELTSVSTTGASEAAQLSAKRQLIALDNQEAAASAREADANIRVAQQQARAAIATKDYAGALHILNVAKEENAGAGAATLGSLETQIAQTEAAGTVTGAFGAQLGALLNPVALVAVGIGAAAKVVGSFGDALRNQGQIQEARAAFDGVYGDIRQGNAVLDAAIANTREYGFTAKETTDAFKQLAPIIRDSTASTQEEAGALERISTIKPEAPVQALTSAIEGIRKGRFQQIAAEMGLGRDAAKLLGDEVLHGKDAFVALNDALDKQGFTLDVARGRMDGYRGAEREAAQAQEDLEKAQADFGAGPGLIIKQGEIRLLTGLTRVLTGDFKDMGQSLHNALVGAPKDAKKLNDELNRTHGIVTGQGGDPVAAAQANQAAQDAYTRSILEGGTEAEAAAARTKALADAQAASAASALAAAQSSGRLKDDTVEAASASDKLNFALNEEIKAKVESEVHTIQLAEYQAQLDRDSKLAAEGLLGAGDQALILAQKYDIAADVAQSLIDKQRGVAAGIGALIDAQTKATAVLTQPGGIGVGAPAISSGSNNSVDAVVQLQEENKKAADKAKKDSDKAAADAARLDDLRNQNRLINAKTTNAKIAELERQKAAATNAIDRQQLQNQIDQERISASKAGRAAGVKGLSATDRADVNLTNNLNEQLQILLDKQAKLKEGSLAWKQIQGQVLDIQEKISAETEKQNRAALDARALAIKDRQDTRTEERRDAGLERALASGRQSPERAAAIRDQIDLDHIEQQRRALELQTKLREAGVAPGAPLDTSTARGAVPTTGGLAPSQAGARVITPQLPIPSAGSTLAAVPTTINLSVTIDGQTGAVTKTSVDPAVILHILGNTVNFRNLSGGTP